MYFKCVPTACHLVIAVLHLHCISYGAYTEVTVYVRLIADIHVHVLLIFMTDLVIGVQYYKCMLSLFLQYLGSLSLHSDCNVVAWSLKASNGICVGTSQGEVIHWCSQNQSSSITEFPFYAEWDSH